MGNQCSLRKFSNFLVNPRGHRFATSVGGSSSVSPNHLANTKRESKINMTITIPQEPRKTNDYSKTYCNGPEDPQGAKDLKREIMREVGQGAADWHNRYVAETKVTHAPK